MLKGFWFLLKYSWRFSKAYIFYIFFYQIISALIPMVTIIIPKYVIDELMSQRRAGVLAAYILILVGYNLVGGLLVTFLQGRSFTSKQIVFCRFQTMIAEKLAKCDFEQLEDPAFLDVKEQAGKFLYANGQGFGVVLDSAVNIIGKSFVFLGLIAILSTIHIFIVLLFIALVLLNTYVESRVRENYVKWDMEKAPIERKTSYFIKLIEDFSYGKEIRLYHLKDWLVSKIEAHLMLSHEFYKKQTKEYNKSNYFSTLTGFVRDLFAYLYLSYRVIAGTIGIGDFTMYLAAVSQFSAAMNNVMQSVLNIKQFGSYYDALEKYMNVPARMREGKRLPIKKGPYEIQFKNVSFKYNAQSIYALKNVNLTLHPSEKLSIVGENGAGKTTFVKLLCRLYDPTEGEILLNGVNIKDYDYDDYMSILAAVFQDYKLFSFTIKENISFSKSEETEDGEIEALLDRSGFGDRLKKLPKGVHSHIYRNFEPDGFEPSGGESQKLCLAKALFKDAPIVVLDEPTAALDPRAEYEIYQKFNELVKGKTAVFISHRLSSSRFCDKIAVFSNGQIVEYGTHAELLQADSIYAELFHMQSQFYV